MDNDERGAIGEGQFELWCRSARMVPVEAKRDLFGWDYFVTVDIREEQPQTGYHRALEPTFKAQVKTIKPGEPSVDITLSHWNRMVHELLPWFVVIFEMELDATSPSAAHVIHIDEPLIHMGLKRLRKREADNDSRALNDIKMALPVGKDNIVPLDGQSFRSFIAAQIGSDPGKTYAAKKGHWIESAFEAGEKRMGFHLQGDSHAEAHEAITDWAVGLRLELSTVRGIAIETALDVSLPFDREHEDQPAILKFKDGPPSTDARVSVSDSGSSELVDVSAKLYSSAGVLHRLHIPARFHKIKIDAPCFSILVRAPETDPKVHISFRYNAEVSRNLRQAAEACRVAHVLANSGRGPLQFRIDTLSEGVWSKAISFRASAPIDIDPAFMRTAGAVNSAAMLAKHFDIELDQIEIDHEELLSRETPLHIFVAAIDRTAELEEVAISDRASLELGERAAVVVPCVIPLGSRILVGIVALVGHPGFQSTKGSGSGLKITKPDVRLVRKYNIREDDWRDEIVADAVSEVAKLLSDDGCAVVFA